MKEINFITSNKGKIDALERSLLHNGATDVRVMGQDLSLVEPQFDTVAEVCEYKARQAFEILKKPVLVEDGGFCIEALNDFPGVYTKYVLSTIGIEGIMHLIGGYSNRRARFVGHACFVDEKGEIHHFSRKKGDVLIADEISPTCSPFAWSDLWKIIYVESAGKCLSEMTSDELNLFYDSDNAVGSVQQFSAWYCKEFFKG